ncbi:MAG: glycosyltransferase family 4 protein [Candidatus Acidiferrales bacterium]
MKPRKITFPLEGFNLGGGIRIVIQVANALAKQGHRVRIIVPDYAAIPPFRLDDSVQLEIKRTRSAKFLRKIYYLLNLSFTSTREADICFATGFKTSYYLCLSKWLRLSRTRLVYLIQHYEALSQAGDGGLWRRGLCFLARLSYRLPLKRIVVSHWIKDKIADENAVLIRNGVDVSTFRPGNGTRNGAADFVVGTVTGAAVWKGYRVFLDAINQMSEEHKQNMKVIVATALQVGLPSGVAAELLKAADDGELASFYSSCDVFVCSSLIEGFGLPGLEAMACGAAVITTACGGVSEYASDSNCLMVPPGDSRAIAESIVRLRENRALRSRLRENALKTSNLLSLEKMNAEYVSLIEELG